MLTSFPAPFDAVVIGASGCIGAALTERLSSAGPVRRVLALSRSNTGPGNEAIIRDRIDLLDEGSIVAAAKRAASVLENPRLILIASGLLHYQDLAPEKTLTALDPTNLARLFAINTIGPALAIKHFAPLLPRTGKSVIAALSARVGSITDNRLGGWYGYRASKAALNQLIKTSAIELAAKRPDLACVGLHPGTVETGMSAPFLAAYKANEIFSPEAAAEHLLRVVDGLTAAHSGGCFAWDGAPIPP
jgi:NAD(P)-dependent dehydrogenase (short-subunit alcohol dehydrogenase family)